MLDKLCSFLKADLLHPCWDLQGPNLHMVNVIVHKLYSFTLHCDGSCTLMILIQSSPRSLPSLTRHHLLPLLPMFDANAFATMHFSAIVARGVVQAPDNSK